MYTQNIVIIDSCIEEGRDFVAGLESSTNLKWDVVVKKSNDRGTLLKELYRYYLYFWVPFVLFLRRKKYRNIIAWQQFYGIIFALYCVLFRVKKTNHLIVMSFIYKRKDGFVGLLYERLIRLVLKSEYVDYYTSVTSSQIPKICKELSLAEDKIKFIPWGIRDLSQQYTHAFETPMPYVFCAGRSNRDWDIVFETFESSQISCRFVCSDNRYKSKKNENIDIYRNLSDEAYFNLLINSSCVVVSIENSDLAGGEITIINALQFGKPVLLIQDAKSSDYIVNGVTGFVVPKDKGIILKTTNELMKNNKLRQEMGENARKSFEKYYSIESVGRNIGILHNMCILS